MPMIASPNHGSRNRLFARPAVRLFLLVWLLTPAMLLVDVAVAQFGQAAQFGRVMAPYYLRRDIRFFVEELQLDEGQQAILESLYYDYEDGHLASQERMKQRFESIKDEAQDLTAANASKEQLFEVVLRPFVEQADDWNRQRFEFLENVQAILSEPQMSLWDGFLRALRRDKELPTGTLMGESVDLMVILRQADIPSAIRSTVEPLMIQYEMALDAALVARERIDLRNQGPMMKSMADPGEEALAMILERIDASTAVRDVNTTYAAMIRDGLPVEHGDRFADLFRSTAFPTFARTTAATRIFEKALELETISEETRTAIADLFAAYRSELEPLVGQMIEVQLRSEPDVEKAKARQFVTRVNAPSPFDAQLNESRQQRNDLDRRYIKQLEGMLLRPEFLSLPGASRFVDRRERAIEANAPAEGSKRRPDPERGTRGVGAGG
jgi:hypothetical protein